MKQACVEQVAIVPCAQTSAELDGTDMTPNADQNEYILYPEWKS
jgi:hypothetical protein